MRMHSVISVRGTARSRSRRWRTALVVVSSRSTVSRSKAFTALRVVAVAGLEAAAGESRLEATGHPSPVDHQLRARDVRGVVAGEEQRRGRDLLGLADAGNRLELIWDLLQGGILQRVAHDRVHATGVDR